LAPITPFRSQGEFVGVILDMHQYGIATIVRM
jgi:hypothetical protein